MKQFFSVKNIETPLGDVIQEALDLKARPFKFENLGNQKTLGLVFLNPSLRTRMSTQIAATNLGMQVIVMNMDKDGWALETRHGVVMDGNTVEHLREAAAVMGSYCDIIGLRSFPKLKDREEDYSEDFFRKFTEYVGVPVISLESATRHPLQSLTDLITITEHAPTDRKPKVLLAWAPHIKALPQAVPNSFAEWMLEAQAQNRVDFSIAHPEGYALKGEFMEGANIYHDLDQALVDVDFIYVKNWSSYENYGSLPKVHGNWMLDEQRLSRSPEAKILHCLPVRRDLELSAALLDGPRSLVIKQASNRVWAAQVVLKSILEQLNKQI